MLLNRIASTFRRLRTDEQGAGMAAVVGLMSVSLLTTSLVATSVVTATEYTTVTRAGVESQAAAEAGIAVARAGLLTGTCVSNSNSYASAANTVPEYVATIWVPSGSSWVRGCPTGTATQVRILSTGYAANDGVLGTDGRDESHLEVVLSSISVPSTIEATGPAIYAYNSQGFGGGGTLVTTGGSDASILIKEGDVTCTGGASGDADIVVNNGNLTVSGGCVITGNAYASGRITLPGGPDIGGNAIANALTMNGGSEIGGSVWVNQDVTLSGGVKIGGNVTAGTMTFSSGGEIGGNVQTTGAVTFNGGGGAWIKGNLTAASFTTGNGGTVEKNAWIYGATSVNWGAVIKGNLTTKSFSKPGGSNSDFVKGTLTVVPGGPTTSPYATNPAKPAWPIVPDWINFDYDPADWSGFAIATITSSGSCSYTQVKNAVASFAGQNGIVNALGCVGGVSIGGSNIVTLNQDVAIFSPSYNLSGGGGFTASQTRKLWLITPDNVVESPTAPTCTTGENSFSVSGGFSFSSNLLVMMYTPCKVALGSSTTFTGQVFSGKAGIAGGAMLTYTAIGLPGYDLNTGLSTTVVSTEADRTIVSFRNVEEGD
ncbi:polymer-forming cytoskeletal protein [Pseudolysinimonas sp.]|uniref:polymer-forming cytoskeletal protein n=1 Tax=Pseudolysinimonas sp. TaxID=2680009 RepID=UPI00286B5902|nr:polymer-forming cytoskeletal protein [Pseudolysinimonas sp.]